MHLGLGPEQQRGESQGRGLGSAGHGGRGAPGAMTCPRLRSGPSSGATGSSSPRPRVLEKLLPRPLLSCVFSTSCTPEPTSELDHRRVQCLQSDCRGEMPENKGAGCEDMAGPRAPVSESMTGGRCRFVLFVNKIQTKEGCLPSRGWQEPQGTQQPFCVERTPGWGPFRSSGSPQRAPWSCSRSAWKS